jgi:hypothetical protein
MYIICSTIEFFICPDYALAITGQKMVNKSGQAGEECSMSAPLRIFVTACGSEERAQQVLMELDAAGYICVPREPTKEMLAAGWAPAHMEDAFETWKAMIASIESESSYD